MIGIIFGDEVGLGQIDSAHLLHSSKHAAASAADAAAAGLLIDDGDTLLDNCGLSSTHVRRV